MYLLFPTCAVDSSGLNLPYHLAKTDSCFNSIFDKGTFQKLYLASLEELKKRSKNEKVFFYCVLLKASLKRAVLRANCMNLPVVIPI